MSSYEKFKEESRLEILELANDSELVSLRKIWMDKLSQHKYTYHFEWMGRPIIQLPQDMIALQEIIFATQPDLIIETGVAHGGSLMLSASILELNATCGGNPDAKVIGIDIDIREENRVLIENHPLSKRIRLIQGSSTDDEVVAEARMESSEKKSVLVLLDSNHTEEHVLLELERYSGLVTPGNYCIVYDTVIEFLDDSMFPNRPWSVGNNPWTAVQKFLALNDTFEVDFDYENKLQMTVAPGGYLRRK